MLSRTQRGFTLIEVMVVVVIVGVISAVVLLSTGLLEDDREMQEESRRMTTLLELAADEALLQGRDFGLEITQSGYRFVEYDPYLEQWFEITDDAILRPRTLPQDVRFELFIEDRRVLLNDQPAALDAEREEDSNDRKANYAPHTLILSSGQLSPFKLAMIRDRDRAEQTIEVTPQGTIETNTDNNDAP
ncbi:MAG: type II secretion system minor pseudopilin GspH [Woeseia sp.]|nr:type II secretion system minor pseudopilin GspH [Woeseia sp.]